MTEEEKLKLLWEIAQGLAKSNGFVLNNYDDYECPFCESTSALSYEFKHDDTCIVTKARALLLHSPLVEKKGTN